MARDELRAGDLVEVRSAAEILATLDSEGTCEGLVFMPEMVPYCGRRFVVDKRADKICDTIHYTGSRRLPDTVLLTDLRCDGAQHAGCQAECRLFWKEAWLRRVSPGDTPTPDGDAAARAALLERAGAGTRKSDDLYRCQGTELFAASCHLRTLDPRPYVRECWTGNVSLARFLRVAARAVVVESMDRLDLLDAPPRTSTSAAAEPPLDLQPGEWVEVKSEDDIRATLNARGTHRGLWFDAAEMAPFCGGRYRVKKRVTRIIDDRTGRLLDFKNACVMLEGVVCSGERSQGRWFCPRAIYPYWRECWLRRVSPPEASTHVPLANMVSR